MMTLAYGRRVSEAFCRKVVGIAADGGFDASWLMAVMAFETADTFSAHIRNPLSGATGLIQFMPSTAADMGTTTEALARKTPEDQLDDVYRYFQPFFGRIKSLSDCYMAVLWPTAVGKADEAVIFSGEQRAYLQNRGLDINRDGGVTKAEAAAKVAERLERGLRPENALDLAALEQPPAPIEDRSQPARPEEKPPMAPTLIMGLLASLMEIFSPVLRAKLTRVLDKQTGDSAISGQVADKVISFAQQAAAQVLPGVVAPPPGVPGTPAPAAPVDPVVAVGAVKSNATLAAQVEAQVSDYLDQLAPVLDRLERLDQAAWQASEASMDAAAARSSGARNDDWMARVLVLGILGMSVGIVLFVGGVAIAQIVTLQTRSPTTEVWAFLTGIGGTILGILGTVFAYRFGTSRTSAAKDVVIEELATRRTRNA